MPLSGSAHLRELAKSSPHLESVALNVTKSARVTDVSVSELLQICGATLKKFAISDITILAAANASRVRPFAPLGTRCHRLEELHLGQGVTLLTTEDLDALSGPSRPPLRSLSLQSATPTRHPGQHASQESTEQLLAKLVKSHASTLQHISISSNIISPVDDLLTACAQLADLRSLDVRMSPFVSGPTIKRLLDTNANLNTYFCLSELRLLNCAGSQQPGCAFCLVKGKRAVRCSDASHQQTCLNLPNNLLDLFEWPQAHQHGYCSSCVLPSRLCTSARVGPLNANTCTYRKVMRILIAFCSAQMEGWRRITDNGEPTYWGVLQPLLLQLAADASPPR